MIFRELKPNKFFKITRVYVLKKKSLKHNKTQQILNYNSILIKY